MLSCCRRILCECRSEKASVFVFVAIAAMMLIGATGTAVDMSRAQILQSRIQTALDAAGLAAGATANTIDVQTQAQKYFNANFPTGYLGSGTVTVVANISGDGATVSLNANTLQATTFMRIFGLPTVAVAASSQVTRANQGMELVLVLDNTGSMGDPVDSSNSSVSKIDALISSINSTGGLLDILYGGDTKNIPNMWIGIVPFTSMVNLGASHSGWLDTTADASYDYGPTITGSGRTAGCPSFGIYTGAAATSGSTRCSYTVPTSKPQPDFGMTNWAGCVTARSFSTSSYSETGLNLDGSDDVPSASSPGTFFPAFYYQSSSSTASSTNTCSGGSNAWNCSRTTGSGANQSQVTTYYEESSTTGGNSNCTQAPILGMVAERQTIQDEVAGMVANGSTMINLGLSWGFRMLSQDWQGLWGGEMDNTGNSKFPVLPLNYHTALMNKVIVLMTDGENDVSGTTAAGSAYQGQSLPTDSQLDTEVSAICTAMKAKGIIIYTIGFGTSSNVNTSLLKGCATQYYSGDSSHYFLAPTNAELSSAFEQIGNSLANLRVSQ